MVPPCRLTAASNHASRERFESRKVTPPNAACRTFYSGNCLETSRCPLGIRQNADRLAGCREAVAATAGVTLTVREGDGVGLRVGRETGDQIAAMPAAERPDGIFAASDMEAIGLMQSLLRAGLQIPDDVAIVGYDDSDFAPNTTVPLSSVRQPALAMGQNAAELLIERFADPDGAVKQIAFDPELVERESTGGGSG